MKANRSLLLCMALFFIGVHAQAYDIVVENKDGEAIYYDIDGNVLQVTNNGENSYSGNLVIPAQVLYKGKTYNVTSIGEEAFLCCNGLTSITIPNSVNCIEKRVFSFCLGLTSITIPNSVTNIGESAFLGCSGLASITIPNSVTNIGESAFLGCSGLAFITIPNSVSSIGKGAFAGCSGIMSIIVDSGNRTYNDGNGSNCIIETSTNTLIVGCQSTTIPNSVTSIGDQAFLGCMGLASITIPNSVTNIGNIAFSGCVNLTSIKVDSGNNIYNDGNNSNCIIETSTNNLIVGCLSTIIPNSVTSIGNEAFRGCMSLTSITIPDSVTGIGNSAFQDCTGLTSVTIPSSVTSISDYAFAFCTGLTSVTIPSSVTNIGNGAFEGCYSLSSIIISNPDTSIGKDAFKGCPGSPSKEAEETLNLYVYAGNLELPKTCSDGMVNTKIVREGDYVVYYLICDEPKYDIDRMQKNIFVLKNKMQEVVNSDLFAPLREVCKNAGVGIGYYYVGKESGKIAKVLMPVYELAE